MEWQDVESERLFEAVRARGTPPEAERTVWAFERALGVARLDPELLRHLLVATVCLVAYEEEQSPRGARRALPALRVGRRVARALRAPARLNRRFSPLVMGYLPDMSEQMQRDPAEQDLSDDRTTGQELASGRPGWTPFAALGSVAGVIAVFAALVIGLAALAYFLA